MPSHFKYRIKKTSENEKSNWDYDSVPQDILDALKDAGAYDDSDSNITTATCAYIQKVNDIGPRYLCSIKLHASRSDLVASDQTVVGKERTQDGSREGRVSGAKKLPLSDEDKHWYDTHFECKYIDARSGKAAKEGVSNEETILFPMCNCYSPRGGLAITHFDGAVKASEAPSYPNPGHLPNVYDSWKESGGLPNPYTSAPTPKYVTQYAKARYPYNPEKLGFLYLMLNARSVVVPCCWWVGKEPLIYKPEYFRVIDLAVAQEKAGSPNKKPVYSTKPGVSNIADYEYREGDYYAPNTGDNYLKNILLGRNYDPTLPQCGNNQRIIYVLDSAVVGDLTQDPLEGDDECKDIPWHFDSGLWFSPRNCSHPDCKVKYQWGSVCNGGGGFDLANGKACPYYENPLIGDEAESDKLCTMNKMYAGDSITGGAVLEMMWLCKGGLPWTKEEWEATWRVPYIWSTVPFNPGKEWTDMMRDQYGNLKKIRGLVLPDYKLYAVKTTIDLNTGKAEQQPPRLLPGGSITQYHKTADGNLNSGDQVPDFPTTIQEIEMKPIASLNIVWPVADLSLLGLNVERSDDFLDKLKELKAKPYNQLVWGPDSKNILVMGYGSSGKYENGVYCINLALMTGKWKSKREELINKLTNMDIISPSSQSLLKELWRDLLKSQVAGADQVIDGMEMQRSFLDSRGMFVFESVPLNLLYRENVILIFGFSAGSTIDATYTKVSPVFNRAYLYQSGSSLMSGWKTTWNGRPSVFFNETSLKEIAGEEYNKMKGKTIDVSLTSSNVPSSTLTGSESVDELMERADALADELKSLNESYASSTDSVVKQHYAKSILDKQAALDRVEQLITNALNDTADTATSSTIYDIAEERSTLQGAIDEIERNIKKAESRQKEASNAGHSSLASYYGSLIDQLKFDIKQLQSQLDLLPEESTSEDNSSSEEEDWKMATCVNVDYDSGDNDTDEGGTIEDTDDDGNTVDITRLYVPFLNSSRDSQKDIDAYKSVLPGGATQNAPNLEIMSDSGIAEWKYFDLGWSGNSGDLSPLWTYAPKGAKRVVVYSTRDFGSDEDTLAGVKLNDSIGKWYALASCSSMLVLVLNPEIANRHNEFMIYSMSAEIDYKWKGADGTPTTLTRKIKFAPFNYTQVNREFPGYSSGKTVEEVGTLNKYGVKHKKISVSEDVEILEKEEGNRHPWIVFAIACDEDSDVKPWPNYNGNWYPGGDVNITTLPKDSSQVQIYIEYAYIGEVYDQDDRKFKDWDDKDTPHKTRLLFNHPKAGTIRTVFKMGDGELGESSEEGDIGVADGFKAVPIGSSSATAMWPYARMACRDYEIHYVWRDNMKNTQVTDRFFMGKGEPRACGGPARRFTSYAHGDHDLGTIYIPKITFGHWEGTGIDRYWDETDIGYSWNTGSQTEEGDPTDNFPTEGGESNTPKNKEGPLYYPYTRGEPHSKYVPIHPVYIWDFLVQYRNKPKKKNYFGGFRMMAADICHIGAQVTRNSTWETYYEYAPDEATSYMGRSRTRGPLFQLEYDDYEEKKPRVVYLKPWGYRNKYTTGATWTYYAGVTATSEEDWDPDELEAAQTDDTPIADNPSDLSKGVWKAICRSLYTAWVRGDTSAYDDLEAQANWGAQRGWEVEYENGLNFPDEEDYTPPTPPDSNIERRTYLADRIQTYKNYIASLQNTVDTQKQLQNSYSVNYDPDSARKIAEMEAEIEYYKSILASFEAELESLGGDPSLAEEEDDSEEEEVATKPTDTTESNVDLLTGCNKSIIQAIDQRGSFFFDNTYMPKSVTSSDWLDSMNEEAKAIKEKLKNSSQRIYWYEQKSFGTNLPWSPYDSPPVFGNTGREMYVVELCTVGSIISWLPTTSEDVSPTKGRSNVPSWWTAREPEGDPVELVTLLPPENECTRAVKQLSSEPQNPFYSYIFDSRPFDETTPNTEHEYKPSDIRIVTKHHSEHYGEAWYRSDTGRMTLTLRDDSECKLTNIKVYGDSPATKESSYMSVTTPSIIEGDTSSSQTPNAGDVSYDRSQLKNALWGADINGLAIESGQSVFVGQRYPGYYSAYTYGKTFVGYKLPGEETGNVYWAWPKSNRNKVTRGERVIKWWTELPDLNSTDKNEPQTETIEDVRLGAISVLKSAIYAPKHPAGDDGREVNLGPDLKKDSQPEGERETVYKDETYYAIVVESERDQGGIVRPPLMWAQQLDSPDEAGNTAKFKRPRGNAVAYKVLQDGSISAVTIGSEQEGVIGSFSTGFLFPKTIRNSEPGGNFITSDIMNEAGKYPAFELGSVSYRHAGKVYSTKDYGAEVLKKYRVFKTKNRYGYNNHVVEAKMLIPNLGCDVLYIEVGYNNYFLEGIEEIFKNRSDKASVEVTVEGTPVAGTDYLGDTYYKTYIRDVPIDKGVNFTEDKVLYDLDFGLAKNITITFKWYVRCNTDEFDSAIWGGSEEKWDADKKIWVPDETNIKNLSDLIDKVTLGAMLPGKCIEVVKIEEAKFVVSKGAQCKKEKVSYNFYEEADSEWYKCDWEESEKDTERNWDQENLFLANTAKGEKQTDEWARGYETMVESFRAAGLDYNKFPKATSFPNSCVELPELPQSRLKIEAWEDEVGKDNYGKSWTFGGVWTTRVAGPEWKTADPRPSRDFIWWPAPHYYEGQIFLKGRAILFGPQYKDEAVVKEDQREAAEDGYNDEAYKNELNGYDKLMRNIQEYEAYRSNVRRGQNAKKAKAASDAQNRKNAATQRSLDSMMSGAGSPVNAPYMAPTNRNYVVNEYKAFAFLDEVGLTPENASWDSVKQKENNKQKELYQEAVKLREDHIGNSTEITATAIIPYYDWQALIELTDSEWYERNGSGDYSPLTEDDIKKLTDDDCSFKWKEWKWEEVQSFTFRDEHEHKYQPDSGDLSKNGLLRRCGRKWIIFDDAKPAKNDIEEAIKALGEAKTALESEKSQAKTTTVQNQIQEAIDKIEEGVTTLEEANDYYKALGKTLWNHYQTRMGSGYGTLPHGYTRDPGVLTALDNAINDTSGEDGYIHKLSAIMDEINDVEVSSKAVNRSLLNATDFINGAVSMIENLVPMMRTVKQKMEYYNNVTEELQTYTRQLIGALGVTMGKSETRIGKIDCHGPQDDDKKGDCDTDGYPQKWEWDSDRDTSSEWPTAVSKDGGKNLFRPDPWWRY